MNKSLLTFLLGYLLISFTACIKKEVTPLADEGATFVKILGGGFPATLVKNPIDFVTTPQTITVCDLRRDAANSEALAKTTSVIIRDDTAAVRAANANYIHMPATWYTLEGATKTGGLGGNYSVNFNAGDFAKEIRINIPNAQLMNPSSLYGMGFTITGVSADGKISFERSLVVEIGAKNPWDGVYAINSGTVTRYTAPGTPANDVLSGPLAGNPDIYLITVGANVVAIPPAGALGGLFWAVGNNSMVAGVDGIRVTIDPATNLTTAASSGNATFGNWAGQTNNYVPSTKTFNLAFRWNPTSTVREYLVSMRFRRSR
jgi:hypothetical protein